MHTGVGTVLRVLPAGPGEGLSFRRTDLPERPMIPARIESVEGVQERHTVLGRGKAAVQTPEHALAACFGLGIDNAVLELDGPEAPIGDGSAAIFVEALRSAGIVPLPADRRRIAIRGLLSLDAGKGSFRVLPNPGRGLTLSYGLSYDHPHLRSQSVTFRVDPEVFAREIAPARTFCLKEEAEALLRAGFGKGADVTNTLVVDRDGAVMGNALRFPDEFARHKLLDLLGDLALAGCALEGHVVAHRTGHGANHRLVRMILEAGGEPPAETPALDVREIRRILPHRYPFLLVDRIEAGTDGRTAVGWKLVAADEEHFHGHFPGNPLMPGVLQLEAMAQVAGALLLKLKQYHGKISVIVSIDKVRFRRPVLPGDRLRIEAEAQIVKDRTAQVSARTTVEGERAAEARFRFMLVEDDKEAR